MEQLDRGLVAVAVGGGAFVSWRLLGTDPAAIAFNLYRDGERVNDAPLIGGTNYLDPRGTPQSQYTVRPVIGGAEGEGSAPVSVWRHPYLEIPLDRPEGGVTPDGVRYTYSANDASVGDLDGDGQYEIVLKWDPSNSKDNAHDGYTGPVYLDAYRLDGQRLWRIDLGLNVRAGAHYTPFIVYDLDGDGRAELAVRTADGTVDGRGRVIGDPTADYRNARGRVLEGPEFLTVFDGETGQARVSIPFEPARGRVSDWGDDYGNRVDRFLAGVAYLDGERPSLIMSRGYYAKTVIVAFDLRGGRLVRRWTFSSEDPGNAAYRGQGNHSLSVADVDGDGRDEIIFGAMVVDDDGRGLYATGWGHGDALHVGDLDPTRPGLEVWQVHESRTSPYGASLRDAQSGAIIWGVHTGRDTGRGMAADIDPRYPGAEMWAAAGVGLWSAQGEKIGSTTPTINFGIWWDGDLLRELLDHDWRPAFGAGVGKIDKWDPEAQRLVNLVTFDGTFSNNGTKGNPALSADILGDWREEVIWRTEDSRALRLYTTTAPTAHRIYTLMHDSQYRVAVAWQNVGYNQPPHPSFFLGVGMAPPPPPAIRTVAPAPRPDR
ncbi:MAG TPA: rhamnogalacturonan lyase [Limnochordia bacterium]